MSSKLRSSTATSGSRHRAIYAPSPEHMAAPGIPARDLAPDEVERYGIDALRNARCYELVPVEAEAPAPEPEAGAAEE